MESRLRQKKFFSKEEALLKASLWCSRQERSQQELREKLREWGQGSGASEQIIAQMVEQGFINEERFARIYAGGKFRILGWGPRRIREGLQYKQVSAYCIDRAIAQFSESDLIAKLRGLLKKKAPAYAGVDPRQQLHKLAQWAISRGYEPAMVWELLNEKD